MPENHYAFVARMFTGARKFPRSFGRWLDGRKVPGGPYKITQIVIGGVVLLLTLFTYTLGWWSTGAWISDIIVGAAVVAGVFWASGKIPQTKRNPVAVVFSTCHALFAPQAGRYRGHTYVAKKPHHATANAGTGTVTPTLTEQPAPVDLAPIPATPTPKPAVTSTAAPISGVARLLAQATHD